MIYKYNIIIIYIYYTYTQSCIYNFTDYKIPASAEKKSLVSFKTESGSGVEEMTERRCRSHQWHRGDAEAIHMFILMDLMGILSLYQGGRSHWPICEFSRTPGMVPQNNTVDSTKYC